MSESIKTFKQGYPFSPSAIGYGITAVAISLIIIAQLSDYYKILGIPFLIIGIYLFFVRRELIINL